MNKTRDSIAAPAVDGPALRDAFRVRRATAEDAAVIARHRAAMCVEIGTSTADLVAALESDTRKYLQDAIPSGEYVAWLAHPAGDVNAIVAGAGVQVRRKLPFPRLHADGTCDVAAGREAIVLNVYTERAYRRRGIARSLMYEILAWSKSVGLESLVLHAAPDGRPLYESLGFVPTNEMRFAGDLIAWRHPELARNERSQ